MPVIFGQPLCETLPVPAPPGVWRPLPSPHCAPALRGSQRSVSSSWASASAGVMSRTTAAARTTVRRMGASLTGRAPAENPLRSKFQQWTLRRPRAVRGVAGLERLERGVVDRLDRDVAEQLDPGELRPVFVVAVDRQRRAGMVAQPGDAGRRPAFGLVVDGAHHELADERERDRLDPRLAVLVEQPEMADQDLVEQRGGPGLKCPRAR